MSTVIKRIYDDMMMMMMMLRFCIKVVNAGYILNDAAFNYVVLIISLNLHLASRLAA